MGKLEDMGTAGCRGGGRRAFSRRSPMWTLPATMTARLKAIEERYQTRLFHRSTRALP